MSDYVIKNGKKVRVCKYQCGQTVAWDNTNNYFVETDNNNVQHTRERCKAFKEIAKDPDKKKAVDTLKEIVNVTNQNNNNKNHTEITWEMVQKKLASIGINIDVEKLLRESDYIQ
jgi:hypothetical protein